MKLANPLYYPIAVLAGGVVLVAGVRLVGLPNFIILPASVVVATGGAAAMKSREPDAQKIAEQQIQKELQLLQTSAKNLAEKAETLRQEANQLLSRGTFEMNLLVAVQEACQRAIELPIKIEELGRRIHGANSLLSVNDLQQQLQEVENKRSSSSGIARQHLDQLANSLQRNIQLAKEGQNARTAQITSLYTLIQNSAGILQQIQNKLRTADLTDYQQISELQASTDELTSLQDNFAFLVRK
ncbi:hypothetical protein IQ247_06845 [Plectonema cf. radiosum LEGE 06105]|uniref:Uncharacterized protein n=1 Tax=Plectonema cf. radiosum LEGE 06105 TaxID=945769 RepID=A0A8J7F0S1_9CYAN|nr:hypothetical protein [Plectonema radiosum]MBE9212430.1 hypothetical protein [Plectonema cf. radiosum LEGE 06105]